MNTNTTEERFGAVPQLAEHTLDFTSAVARDRGPKLFMAGVKYADKNPRECAILLKNLAADLDAIRCGFPEVNADTLVFAEREMFMKHLVSLEVSGTELSDGVSLFDDIIT